MEKRILNVIALMEITARMRDKIDKINGAEQFGQIMGRDYLHVLLDVPKDEVPKVVAATKNITQKLKSALLELPPQEATEILQRAATVEDYKYAIDTVYHDESTLISERIMFSKLTRPEEADQIVSEVLQKFIDGANSPENALQGLINPRSKEFRELQEKMDRTLLFFVPLKALHEEGSVNDEVVGLALDVFHSKKAEYLEKLSEALISVVTQANNLDTLERIAKIWREVLPDSLNTKLTKMYLGTSDPKAKENIKNTIILMGKNPLQLIQGEDVIMGDNIEIKDIQNAQIAVKSREVIFENIEQTINDSTTLGQDTKAELEKLLKELNKELEVVPIANAKDAKTVAKRAKTLIEVADEEEIDEDYLKKSGERLLKAAKNVELVIPTVVSITKKIISLLISA